MMEIVCKLHIKNDGSVGTGPERQLDLFSLFIDVPDKEMNVCIKFVDPRLGVVLIFWKIVIKLR